MSGANLEHPVGSALDIDSQAADFLVRRRGPTWSADDEARFNAWLAESFACQTAFWRLESVWDRADRLNALRPLSSHGGVAHAHNRRSRWYAIAAAVATVAAIGASATFLAPQSDTTTYTTPVGGREIIRLADGSQIELNTNTVLRTRLHAGARGAELVKGEALFQIKHDAAHPFVVVAAHHRVTDLGTKFLVREDRDKLTVSLLEGSARVESSNAQSRTKPALLQPGDVAIATAGTLSVMRRSHQELDREASWQRGVLVFHRSTLIDVAKEYNRYNDRKIVVADAVAGARVINATLPANDVGAFARMARDFLGLHVEERQSEIVISR